MPSVVDNQAIHNIIDKYSPMIYKIAYQNTRDKYLSDDITQEVFIKLLRSDKSFDSEEHLKAWLIRVTLNEVNGIFRKADKIETVPLPEDDSLFVDASENDLHLLDEILKLKKNYKNVIYLHYYEGYTIKEIAKILGKKENTISTWLRRAKLELEQILKEVNP